MLVNNFQNNIFVSSKIASRTLDILAKRPHLLTRELAHAMTCVRTTPK